eukprot:7624750-Prorocentrum_lima.AAC.1
MTSSLVGSEMCNKRQVLWLGQLPDLHGNDDFIEGELWRRMPQPSFSTRAVSYTHLTLPTICSV